jgi:hypothetical protein
MSDYEFQEYPKWVYFPEPLEVYPAGLEPVLVQDAKEEKKVRKSVEATVVAPVDTPAEVPAA